MPMTFTTNPPGLAELLRSSTGATGQFILKVATEVAGAAKAGAPRVTGKLAGSIHATPTRIANNPCAFVTADAPYSLFVHEGTRPHPIDPVRAKVLRFPAKSGMIVFTPHVDHPGTSPQPFLTDALSSVFSAF